MGQKDPTKFLKLGSCVRGLAQAKIDFSVSGAFEFENMKKILFLSVTKNRFEDFHSTLNGSRNRVLMV